MFSAADFSLLSLPSPFLAESGFWFAIRESSWPGIVVCVVLAVLSCFSWAVMVSKFRTVSRTAGRDELFLEAFREQHDPLALYESGEFIKKSAMAGIYHAGARELTYHLTGSSEVDDNFRDRLDESEKVRPSELDAVSNAMDRAVSGATGRLETQMTVLATAVSGAPFLGLLGTVWGVMDTFSGVASSAGVASLKTMAPGVSAALVTTVVALLVAIPAMFGYNFLVNRIRAMVMGYDNLAAELRLDFERWYVDHAVEQRAAQPAVAAARAARPKTKKKARLVAQELAPVGATVEQAEVREAEPPSPSHRMVKREPEPDPEMELELDSEQVLVNGEFDLERGED